MTGRSGEPRGKRLWLAVVAAIGLGALAFHGCHDASGPETEPPDPDYKITYSRAADTFTVRQPRGSSVGPMPELLIVATQEDPDSNRVTLSVAFENTGADILVAPDGVALFDFVAGERPAPASGAPCAAPALTIPEAPSGSGIRDHRGSAGTCALLS